MILATAAVADFVDLPGSQFFKGGYIIKDRKDRSKYMQKRE